MDDSFSIDKKLSKEQKISILVRARDVIKNKEEICMCPAIADSFNRLHIVLISGGGVYIPWTFGKSLKEFPRLLDFKPKNKEAGETWFSYDWFGRRKRIKILNRLIKELKNE